MPTTDDVLSAVRGQGAHLNGQPLYAQEPPGDLRDIGVALEADSHGFTEAQRTLHPSIGRGYYASGSAVYPMGQILLAGSTEPLLAVG